MLATWSGAEGGVYWLIGLVLFIAAVMCVLVYAEHHQ